MQVLKNKLLWVFVLVSPIFPSDTDGNLSIGFRKAKWGMTINQVKRSEKLKLIQTDSGLISDQMDTIFGNECRVIFSFFENKFHRGGYLCTVSEDNLWHLHKMFREKLVAKYGETTNDNWESGGKRVSLRGEDNGRTGDVLIIYEDIGSRARELESFAKQEAARKEREAAESAGKL